MKNRERMLTACCVVALAWLNAYWCRQVFVLDHIGQMNSMHGFWIGLARLAGMAWFKPVWWHYSYDGMPFEYTYAPLVPGLLAGISRLTGWSLGRAFDVLAGAVFCFGPVAMFLMAKELTRRTAWSFVAAVAYCLFAPSQLLAPDAEFRLQHLRDPRRLMLTFNWDEVPHELALTLASLAVLFLVRGLRLRKTGSFVWAGLFIALALLANAFGATAMLMVLLCLWVSWDTGDWKRNGVSLALCALLAYLSMCPFLPPALITVIRRNASLAPESAWTWASLGTLAAVAGGVVLLWLLSRRCPQWYIRFFLLLACVCSAIPILDRWNLHFLPQAGRYKVEMEMWLVLLVVFAAAAWVDRAPAIARVALALILLWPAVAQVKSYRRYAKDLIRSSDVHQTIEYQVADWLQANLPEGRVFAPGSIGQWMNAFTGQQQFGGGSFPTIPALPMQYPMFGIPYLEPSSESVELTMLWLRAYGVDALVVPGPHSPEYWKPFHAPEKFSGPLPLLWQERDTSIYAVPRGHTSIVHVIQETALVRRAPQQYSDVSEVRVYVAALENRPASQTEWHWIDDNHARIRTILEPGDIVSLQMTYHPGWTAVAGGKSASIAPDGLAQVVIHPDCTGVCEVDLSYDGGWEAKTLRVVSLATILAIVVFACGMCWRRRRAGAPRMP